MCNGGQCDPEWLRGQGMELTARLEEGSQVTELGVGFPVWVPVPDDYSPDEVVAFKRIVSEALVPVVKDAQMDIDSRRVQS